MAMLKWWLASYGTLKKAFKAGIPLGQFHWGKTKPTA
jgi:hypothetical protein